MDAAYDHITEESYPQDPPKPPPATGNSSATPGTADASTPAASSNPTTFNTEVQEAYKAISSSPWAARLGGFLGTVKKQGEQYYDTASKQYATTSASATAGVSSLIGHARSLSMQPGGEGGTASEEERGGSQDKGKEKEKVEDHPDRPESLPADIVREAEGMLARFRAEATKRFKDLEKAEDAADEALLKFGSNIRSFLADAVSIAPPAAGSDGSGAVLFESKDSSGKKVVHATRFDAQLHVIHSTLDSFLKDPVSPQWAEWKAAFDADTKTEAIAVDLEKHAELRTAMEKCVPERVDYKTFWCRYYYLRHVIESEEQRRRELLKASTPADEEITWDADSDSDSDSDSASASTPAAATAPTTKHKTTTTPTATLTASKETLKPIAAQEEEKDNDTATLKPRRSNDENSDASYDLVSGATSRGPGSPKALAQEKGKAEPKVMQQQEESDEEDWE